MNNKKFYFRNYLFYVAVTLICILLLTLIIIVDSAFASKLNASVTKIEINNVSTLMEGYGQTNYLPLSFVHFYYINEAGYVRTSVNSLEECNAYNIVNIISLIDFIVIGIILLVQIGYAIYMLKTMLKSQQGKNIILPIITMISNIMLISMIGFFSWAYLITFVIVLIVNFLLAFMLYVIKENQKE